MSNVEQLNVFERRIAKKLHFLKMRFANCSPKEIQIWTDEIMQFRNLNGQFSISPNLSRSRDLFIFPGFEVFFSDPPAQCRQGLPKRTIAFQIRYLTADSACLCFKYWPAL